MTLIPKFSLHHIHKSFASKAVLRGITLDIMPGESMVIIGGSGTGKSVLLKCLLGFLKIDSGTLKMDGMDIVGESATRNATRLQDIGVVFQGSALFDSLTVWENVAFRLLYAQHMPREQARAVALQNLEAVGLNAVVATLFPSEISGGMQRRVALARAVTTQPQVLFFDEPTAGLDPIFSATINTLISHSVKELGATAVTITHDMKSARQIGDRIAILHEGRIIWCGPAHEIDGCEDPYVQQFIQGLPSPLKKG